MPRSARRRSPKLLVAFRMSRTWHASPSARLLTRTHARAYQSGTPASGQAVPRWSLARLLKKSEKTLDTVAPSRETPGHPDTGALEFPARALGQICGATVQRTTS